MIPTNRIFTFLAAPLQFTIKPILWIKESALLHYVKFSFTIDDSTELAGRTGKNDSVFVWICLVKSHLILASVSTTYCVHA